MAAARKLCCYLFWMLKEKRTYPEWLQNRHSQPPAGGAPDVTPGALHTGRRQTGWATSFEHGILCHNAHEEAAEVFFYLLPCEVHGPGGSAPYRVWMGFVQTPGIPLPLALSFFRGGVTAKGRPKGWQDQHFSGCTLSTAWGWRLDSLIRSWVRPLPKLFLQHRAKVRKVTVPGVESRSPLVKLRKGGEQRQEWPLHREHRRRTVHFQRGNRCCRECDQE